MSRVAFVACLLSATTASAQLSSRGHVGLETRAFVPDRDDATEDWGLGLSARVEMAHRHRPFREQIRAFARIDTLDDERNIVIPEEAWFGARTKWFRTRLGAQMLDWTATEAFHPADVINSRNLDSNIENAEKIGEPMYFLGVKFFQGEISGYYLPMRLAPNIPGPSSRLSFSPVEVSGARWVDRDGAISASMFEHQWAATISQTLGPVDVAVQVLQHNDRSQPTVVLDDALSPHPLYHQVTHVGLTAVWPTEYLSVKLEGAYRMFDDDVDFTGYVPVAGTVPEDHAQIAVGFDFGWEWESGHESTWLLEGQAVLGPDDDERRRLSPFQADVLIGYRHVFNDIDSKELLLGVILDVEDPEQLIVNANYRQRLSDTWSLEASLRVIHAPQEGDFPEGLEALHEANSISLNLLRNF